MKRIAVFSDTHHQFTRLPAAIGKMGKVDRIFHLGDYGADAERISGAAGGVPFVAVRGNNDYFTDLPRVLVERVEDASILLVHGDAFYTLGSLFHAAEQRGCGVVLFGHTHEPLMQASGKILALNPGSLSLPRRGYPAAFAVLEVSGGDIGAKIIPLE